MVRESGAEASAETSEEEEELDLARVKLIAGYVARAPRRRPRAAIVTLVLTLLFGAAVVALWPRMYISYTRILAQPNAVMPALDNPNRAQRESESPTKNAPDQILKHENLEALVTQLNLVERWRAARQPAFRIKDALFGLLVTKSDADLQRDMIERLEKKLTISADESAVVISLEWADRQMAYEIVDALEKNFLAARYDTNVKVIEEAIRILEDRAKPQAADVDAALADLIKVEQDRRKVLATQRGGAAAASASGGGGGAVAPVPRGPVRSPAVASAATPVGDDSSDAAQELEGVRKKIRALQDEHARQLADAQKQLADARTTLGPAHPTVLGLTEKVTALQEPPAELDALSERERALVAEIAGAVHAPPAATSGAGTAGGGGSGSRSGGTTSPTSPRPASTAAREEGPSASLPVDLKDDPETLVANQRLRAQSVKYDDLLSRIEAAKIELDVTRAAFKYQYSVVRPPELARGPSKPNVPLLVLASLLAALLLTVLVPAALDMRAGRFVETWQIEHTLKLPMLGELALPESTTRDEQA